MLKNRGVRRVVAISLVILGGLLMALAPEIWEGLLALAVGIGIELAGIAMERKA
ncbi:hypothetical protein [Thiobacillus thioparus]|uniref:hypothetical protein n=1 Tax=Thiobacillus thioparus TaxID=931 RepID=UPI000364547A|nr:hypothetical protein [Thiobacillus thioparus]